MSANLFEVKLSFGRNAALIETKDTMLRNYLEKLCPRYKDLFYVNVEFENNVIDTLELWHKLLQFYPEIERRLESGRSVHETFAWLLVEAVKMMQPHKLLNMPDGSPADEQEFVTALVWLLQRYCYARTVLNEEYDVETRTYCALRIAEATNPQLFRDKLWLNPLDAVLTWHELDGSFLEQASAVTIRPAGRIAFGYWIDTRGKYLLRTYFTNDRQLKVEVLEKARPLDLAHLLILKCMYKDYWPLTEEQLNELARKAKSSIAVMRLINLEFLAGGTKETRRALNLIEAVN